jgi:hypothetical protein
MMSIMSATFHRPHVKGLRERKAARLWVWKEDSQIDFDEQSVFLILVHIVP